MAEKTFTDGLIFKLPREGAPDFVKGSLSIKVEEFKAFLDEHVTNSGWLNIDLLVGKSMKPYAALNTFVPEKPGVVKEEVEAAPIEYPVEDINPDDIPF